MRLTKSFLSIISAQGLAAGAAFAGGDSMSHQGSISPEGSMSFQSSESGGPEPLGGYEVTTEGDVLSSSGLEESDRELFAESETIYIYPLQVTEYYVFVPSVDSEMPQG